MVLTVNNVTLDFEGLRALDAVSMAIEPGSLAALVGPNGAKEPGSIAMLTVSSARSPSKSSVTSSTVRTIGLSLIHI